MFTKMILMCAQACVVTLMCIHVVACRHLLLVFSVFHALVLMHYFMHYFLFTQETISHA